MEKFVYTTTSKNILIYVYAPSNKKSFKMKRNFINLKNFYNFFRLQLCFSIIFSNNQKHGNGNGGYGYDRPYTRYEHNGPIRKQNKFRYKVGFRTEGYRGSSPYKYRYQDGAEYDQKEEKMTFDPRAFFSQKPQEEVEKDSNSVQHYYTHKYRKLLDRENLKRNIEDDIYKVNPQLDHYILNRLIKIRLLFDDKQRNSEQTQKNEDIFQFDELDLKRFFSTFGKIEKIVIKDKCVSYIFFQDLVSAFCAQRALNNFALEDINARLEIQLCVEDPEEENENKLIGHFMHEAIEDIDYLIRINTEEDEKQVKQLISKYKYTNIFTMEINDPEYHLKERIMGASASNFYRLIYLCEKNQVETGHGQNSTDVCEDLVISLDQAKELRNQQNNSSTNNKLLSNSTTEGLNAQKNINNNTNSMNNTNLNQNSNNISNNSKNKLSTQNINNINATGNKINNNNTNSTNSNSNCNQSEDITFRMIINETKQTENEVLILSNNLEKYNTAVRYMHELLAQVNEEYRHFCEFQKKVNPGPLHIKRIEKFNLEPELMFISTKDLMNKNAIGKDQQMQKGDDNRSGGGGLMGSPPFPFTQQSNNTHIYSSSAMQIEQPSSSTAGSGNIQDIQQKLQF